MPLLFVFFTLLLASHSSSAAKTDKSAAKADASAAVVEASSSTTTTAAAADEIPKADDKVSSSTSASEVDSLKSANGSADAGSSNAPEVADVKADPDGKEAKLQDSGSDVKSNVTKDLDSVSSNSNATAAVKEDAAALGDDNNVPLKAEKNVTDSDHMATGDSKIGKNDAHLTAGRPEGRALSDEARNMSAAAEENKDMVGNRTNDLFEAKNPTPVNQTLSSRLPAAVGAQFNEVSNPIVASANGSEIELVASTPRAPLIAEAMVSTNTTAAPRAAEEKAAAVKAAGGKLPRSSAAAATAAASWWGITSLIAAFIVSRSG